MKRERKRKGKEREEEEMKDKKREGSFKMDNLIFSRGKRRNN